MREESDFKERLGFDDRVVFRKGVECMDEEGAWRLLDLHETEGDRGPAICGCEVVCDQGLAAVFEEFLVKMEEDFGFELFELEADVVLESGFKVDGFLAMPLEFLSIEFFVEREGGFTRGGDFAENAGVMLVGDDVSRIADLESS